MCLHVYISPYVCMYSTYRGEKNELDPLELELQVISCMRVLGVKHRFLEEQPMLITAEPSD